MNAKQYREQRDAFVVHLRDLVEAGESLIGGTGSTDKLTQELIAGRALLDLHDNPPPTQGMGVTPS